MLKTAMIFAAGRGERLRPLTDHVCKAMCPVKGIPLIEHHVRNLADAGIRNIIINHAYLGSQIYQHLQNGKRFGVQITYSAEPPGALETEGGIVQALSLLGRAPFIALSADIFTDFPFERLLLPTGSPAHLVLTPLSEDIPKGDFSLSDDGVIKNAPCTHTYANIGCFDPSIFQVTPLRRAKLGKVLRTLIENHRVTGEIYTGQWINIGNMAQLQSANNAR